MAVGTATQDQASDPFTADPKLLGATVDEALRVLLNRFVRGEVPTYADSLLVVRSRVALAYLVTRAAKPL